MGPFVNPGFPPVNRSEDNQKLADGAVLANIKRMAPGDIGYGYIGAYEPFLSTLSSSKFSTVFVYRDPRDMIVSHVFYATQIHKEHGMYNYYNEKLNTMEERINAAICGVQEPGYELTPIRDRYMKYLGWLKQPGVLCLRFEDLILKQESTLGQFLDFLETRGFKPEISRAEAISILRMAIQPKRSGTFRKAKPGNWREHFTETNKAMFKEKTGDLLIQLGYEKNANW